MRLLPVLFLLLLFAPAVQDLFAGDFQPKKKIFKSRKERRALRKARNYTLHGNYSRAREEYLKLVQIDSSSFEYNYELGMNYYFAYECGDETIKYLRAALRHSRKDTIGELFYYLADACHQAGLYNEALAYFNRFQPYIMEGKKSDPLRREISDRIKQCGQAKIYEQEVNKTIFIENLGNPINSENAEYAPVVNESDSLLMFTARYKTNKGGGLDHWDEKYFEDMYIARKDSRSFSKPEPFIASDKYVSLIPNSKKHDAVVSLSLDEKQLITYKKNMLWISELKNNGWSGPDLLPATINVGKYQPHASLSSDGKTIYFTSDKPGGMGGLDIYKCTQLSRGRWSEPVNLGPAVNTDQDEDSPNISADGRTLFFSSKGHNGMGGYDIFRSNFDPSAGQWSEAINLGIPINSPGDDIFYKPNKNGTMAYFASYRPEGYGDMDIYRQTFIKVPDFENCLSKADLERSHPLVLFEIFSKDTFRVKEDAVFKAVNPAFGSYSFNGYYWKIENETILDSAAVHHVFNTPGVYQVKLGAFVVDKDKVEQFTFCVSREIKVMDKEETVLVMNGTLNKDSLKNLNKNNLPGLTLQKIYYDFNRFNIRTDAREILDKNIELLKQHPEVVIKVSANTDSRGSTAYNQRLSEKRARAAVNYLVKHGINKNRIIAVISNGENELVNKCTDGTECPDSEHEKNRRTEFIILGTKK